MTPLSRPYPRGIKFSESNTPLDSLAATCQRPSLPLSNVLASGVDSLRPVPGELESVNAAGPFRAYAHAAAILNQER